MARKERDQDPASVRGQKVKVMQHGKMTSTTQLSGAKENTKVKARRARKRTGDMMMLIGQMTGQNGTHPITDMMNTIGIVGLHTMFLLKNRP